MDLGPSDLSLELNDADDTMAMELSPLEEEDVLRTPEPVADDIDEPTTTVKKRKLEASASGREVSSAPAAEKTGRAVSSAPKKRGRAVTSTTNEPGCVVSPSPRRPEREVSTGRRFTKPADGPIRVKFASEETMRFLPHPTPEISLADCFTPVVENETKHLQNWIKRELKAMYNGIAKLTDALATDIKTLIKNQAEVNKKLGVIFANFNTQYTTLSQNKSVTYDEMVAVSKAQKDIIISARRNDYRRLRNLILGRPEGDGVDAEDPGNLEAQYFDFGLQLKNPRKNDYLFICMSHVHKG
jgi:hypothetical protein